MCRRALGAIGRRAIKLQLFARTLRQERGGAAAVAVDRSYAAQGNHELSHLVAGETSRIGRLTTVIHDHYKGAVGLNANERAGSTVIGVIVDFVLVNTVFD